MGDKNPRKLKRNRYQRRMLDALVGHMDGAVMIDDANTDRSTVSCEDILSDILRHLIQNKPFIRCCAQSDSLASR